jgi:hypothetical protein
VKRAATNFPIFQNAGGERIVYNLNTAGTWSTQQISQNSNWGVVYLVATNSITDPVIAILGQAAYANSNTASAATFGDLSLGNLPFQEMKAIAKLIFKTSTSYGNSVKAYVDAITDLRNAQTLPSGNFVATDHNSLTGRDASSSHPATAVATSTTNFAGSLTTAETDTQLALDKLDDHDHTGLTVKGKLEPPAGTASAGTAPIKTTAGTLNSSPENGAWEDDGTHVYVTEGGVRYQLDRQFGSKFANANVAGGAGWTTLGSITVPTNAVVTFHAWFSGRDKTSNDSAGYTVRGVAQRVSGTVSVQSLVEEKLYYVDAAWNVRANGGATTVDFDCYPDATNATDWTCVAVSTIQGGL